MTKKKQRGLAPATEGREGSPYSVVGALLVVLVVFYWMDSCSDTPDRGARISSAAYERASTKVAIKALLRDPESAVFDFIKPEPGAKAVCGYVNAKNGLGGYSGKKLFVVRSGRILYFEGEIESIGAIEAIAQYC